MADIYSSEDANFLLGILLNDSSRILDDKYPLNKDDFECVLFQKIIYSVIYNLAIKGVKTFGGMEIAEFLADYPIQEQVFKDNDGLNYIETIKELTEDKVDNFEFYWSSIRKHSMLRQYDKNGFDVSWVWNKEESNYKNEEELNKYTINDIVGHYNIISSDIMKQYNINRQYEEYKAGTDFLKTKEIFKENPLLGNSFQSEYLNDIFNGMYGLIIRVAKSGGGKSVLSIGDLCKCTIKEYWDSEKQKWVKNKSRAGAGLFINTEMEVRNQLDPLIIAWISGVDRGHIIRGIYEDDEEERVDYAAQVLSDSELYIVDDPCFTVKSISSTIENYVLKYNIKTVCHDYLQNNGYVANELGQESGTYKQEWQILLALTDRLKQIQLKYGISFISSVQSNGNEDTTSNPNESCLAGSKGQVRKVDGCFAMFPPTKKELEQTRLMLQKRGFGGDTDTYINNVCHIIKGRNSKYEKYIKVFQHIDYGTGRSIDLYCTDKNNNPIRVDRLRIECE